MTLDPGDIIITGTPSGVAMARKPQPWLKPGDVCEVEIEEHRHPAQHDRPGARCHRRSRLGVQRPNWQAPQGAAASPRPWDPRSRHALGAASVRAVEPRSRRSVCRGHPT